jgi:hypothetical protein
MRIARFTIAWNSDSKSVSRSERLSRSRVRRPTSMSWLRTRSTSNGAPCSQRCLGLVVCRAFAGSWLVAGGRPPKPSPERTTVAWHLDGQVVRHSKSAPTLAEMGHFGHFATFSACPLLHQTRVANRPQKVCERNESPETSVALLRRPIRQTVQSGAQCNRENWGVGRRGRAALPCDPCPHHPTGPDAQVCTQQNEAL